MDGKKFNIGPGKMRVLCIGVHPDDCEFKCDGTVVLWRRQGNNEKNLRPGFFPLTISHSRSIFDKK